MFISLTVIPAHISNIQMIWYNLNFWRISYIGDYFVFKILLLVYVRRGLNYVFSQKELQWLDHLLPCKERREKEDKDKDYDKKEKRGLKARLKQVKT